MMQFDVTKITPVTKEACKAHGRQARESCELMVVCGSVSVHAGKLDTDHFFRLYEHSRARASF